METCQRIEAIGMKLLTCIYDPKTYNLHSSFHYTLLTFSWLWCWITWNTSFYLSVCKNFAKCPAKAPEKSGEFMDTGS